MHSLGPGGVEPSHFLAYFFLSLSFTLSARLCFPSLYFCGCHGMGLTGWKSWLRGQRDGGTDGRSQVCESPPPQDQGTQCCSEYLREFASTLFQFYKKEGLNGGGGVAGGCEVFNGREEFCATRVRGIKFHTLTKANSCRAAGRAHTGSSSSGIWCCRTENILQGPRSRIWFYTAISSPTTHNVPPRLSPVISAIQPPI